MGALGVAVAALSPFYSTATAILVGLLITWLGAETRGLREDLIEKRRDPTAAHIRRIPRGSILPIALGLAAGVLVALRVQFRVQADVWEEIVVWSTLGLGLVAVAFSLVVNVLERTEFTPNEALLRRLRRGKRWGALAAAVFCGVLASPIFHEQPVRRVGAKFAVYGTCFTGGCGLKQRLGPGPDFREVDRRERLQDGELVLVVCQTSGGALKGYDNRVWDLLPNGRYVSDAFVDTPNRNGGFSSGLPKCRPGASVGTAG